MKSDNRFAKLVRASTNRVLLPKNNPPVILSKPPVMLPATITITAVLIDNHREGVIIPLKQFIRIDDEEPWVKDDP
jgi:hypothetical protein